MHMRRSFATVGLLASLLLGQVSVHAGPALDGPATLPPPPGGLLPLPPMTLAARTAIQPAAAPLSNAPLPYARLTEYPVPTAGAVPNVLTLGPNGNIWFTEYNAGKVAQAAPGGLVTEYMPPSSTTLAGIVNGPDGRLWFAEESANSVGRLALLDTFAEFPAPVASSEPLGITRGPDGNLWLTQQECCVAPSGQIAKITTGGLITEYTLPRAGAEPQNIVTGPDGSLWFTEFGLNAIGRITLAGAVTEFPVSGGPDGIARGRDGALWFTEYLGGKIGRLSTSGILTEYPIPNAASGPIGITSGPDGALYFAEYGGNSIGRITTAGTFAEYRLPTANAGPASLAFRGDALWFSESNVDRIGVLRSDS